MKTINLKSHYIISIYFSQLIEQHNTFFGRVMAISILYKYKHYIIPLNAIYLGKVEK